MKKKPILNKETLPALFTVESYIIWITFGERDDSNQIEVSLTWILNFLTSLLSYQYINVPILYEAL